VLTHPAIKHPQLAAGDAVGGVAQAKAQQQSQNTVAPLGAHSRGSFSLGAGVRVTAAGPRQGAAVKSKTIHALWVHGYDAGLDGFHPSQSRHGFLLCDGDSFQPRQPRQMIGSKKLCQEAGFTKNVTGCVRLAQAWTSAPGGPTHAEGTTLCDVSVPQLRNVREVYLALCISGFSNQNRLNVKHTTIALMALRCNAFGVMPVLALSA
jgi:hypothetical protein